MKTTYLSLIFVTLLMGSCSTVPVTVIDGVGPSSPLVAPGKSKTITIATFNDYHGALEEDRTGKNVGAAKLARVVQDWREQNPALLLLSAGDNYQGSALSNITKGKVVSEVFRAWGVSASAVGNHEFDWGNGGFSDWSAEGGFPFLAANIVEASTGEVPSWARPYALYRVGGHLVAVLGLSTLDTLSSTKADNLKSYRFLDPETTARTWVNRLESTYRPELIIALTHLPSATNLRNRGEAVSASSARELEKLARVRGLDLIVTGHSHLFVSAETGGVPVVQAQNYGRALGKISVTFQADGSKSLSYQVDEIWKSKAEIPEDPQVLALVARYEEQFGGPLRERVATVEGELSHEAEEPNLTPMGVWVCQVLRQRFGVDLAITNGGGLRRGFEPGPVFVKDYWELMPFDNTAVTFEVKGADLKLILDHGIDATDFRPGQFAGGTVTYSPQAPVGKRVKSIRLDDGRMVEDDQWYSVVTNDFVFVGGDRYSMILPAAKNTRDTYLPIRDLLIEVSRQSKVIKAPELAGLVVQP